MTETWFTFLVLHCSSFDAVLASVTRSAVAAGHTRKCRRGVLQAVLNKRSTVLATRLIIVAKITSRAVDAIYTGVVDHTLETDRRRSIGLTAVDCWKAFPVKNHQSTTIAQGTVIGCRDECIVQYARAAACGSGTYSTVLFSSGLAAKGSLIEAPTLTVKETSDARDRSIE